MSTVLLAAPPPPPVPPVPPAPAASIWNRSQIRLEAEDGDVWDLTDYTSGVFLVKGQFTGLHMPPFERRNSTSAAEHGSRRRSHRVTERPVVLPIFVYSDEGSEAWLERDAALWRALHPDKVCDLVFIPPGKRARRLHLSHVGNDQGYERDPIAFGWTPYVLDMVAEAPFWEGTPVVRQWDESLPVPFFGGTTGKLKGPPYHVSSAFRLGSATLDNPGDVEGYAVWTVEAIGGDIESVTVGVGNRLTTASFLIPEGESITIDPRPGPRGKSVYDSRGRRRTNELSARNFTSIPAGQSVPLSLEIVGSGRVTATLVPRHYRAWG